MDTVETILSRRSIRQYLNEPIAADDLTRIMECARQAPSAGNRQPTHFVVVTDPKLRRELAQASHDQTWMADAAAIIAALGDPSISENWYAVDTAIAMQNLILAATGLGYGTCWVGAFDEAQVKAILGIPEELRVVALTPVGKPAHQPDARPRRNMADFASLQRYGQHFSL
ncbi:MAG: nitroreductase family protein [Armatimonadota bacterium]|nr:MAG: nitroreductase family protein [Armatimonadota bacterium]